MSEETKKNPIWLVTELLAEMTARVVISIHTPTQGVTANINKIYSSYSSIFVYY